MKIKLIMTLMVMLLASSLIGQEKEKKVKRSFNIELGANSDLFFEDGAYLGQQQIYPSIFMRPKFKLEWKKRNAIIFEGFARWDILGDSRTHWDLREFYYQNYKGNWEFNIGMKKVFWGKTEGLNVVDVINQVDFLEGVDGKEKLGQPLLETSYSSRIGTFSLFAMPYNRTISFANEKGRFRTQKIITDNQVSFESDLENWHPSFAFRWSHFIGDSDIGLHYFNGTSREPLVIFDNQGNFGLEYPQINQLGIDYQIIVKNLALKLESIYRMGSFDNIFALTGGAEFTFGNVNEKGLDIGALA